MNPMFDRTRTLEQLECSDWGGPAFDSALVMMIHQLRRRPINSLSVEDLRILIGQNVGLPYLISLAIERLADGPLTRGDLYRGDLLKQVLSLEPEFWRTHTELYKEVEKVISDLEIIRDTIENELLLAAGHFRGNKS